LAISQLPDLPIPLSEKTSPKIKHYYIIIVTEKHEETMNIPPIFRHSRNPNIYNMLLNRAQGTPHPNGQTCEHMLISIRIPQPISYSQTISESRPNINSIYTPHFMQYVIPYLL